ncbi:hypothetical protein T484DRAFT_1757686, partial [Baffinella frigidus]
MIPLRYAHEHLEGDFVPQDISGSNNDIAANTYLSDMNNNENIKQLLGHGRMFTTKTYGNRELKKTKMNALTSEMQDTMLRYKSTGPMDFIKTDFDLALVTRTFCPNSRLTKKQLDSLANGELPVDGRSLHALDIVKKASNVMKMIAQQTNDVVLKYQHHANCAVRAEKSLSDAIETSWNSNAKSSQYRIKAQLSSAKGFIDITIWIHTDREETGYAPTCVIESQYVVQVELKTFQSEEPKVRSATFNGVCEQIRTYTGTSVSEGKVIPVAFMLMYTVHRPVTQRPTNDEITEKQVHSFWWPTCKALYAHHVKDGLDQNDWGHRGARLLDDSPDSSDDSDSNANAVVVQPAAQSSVQPVVQPSPAVVAGGEPSNEGGMSPTGSDGMSPQTETRSRRVADKPNTVSKRKTGTPPETNLPKRRKNQKRKTSNQVDSEDEEECNKDDDEEDDEDGENSLVLEWNGQDAEHEESDSSDIIQDTVATTLQNKDPALYLKGFAKTDPQFHFLDPVYLKGAFVRNKSIQYVPGLQWKLETDDFQNMEDIDDLIVQKVTQTTAALQLTYSWVAIQYRNKRVRGKRQKCYYEGSWILGRIVDVHSYHKYINLIVDHPGHLIGHGGRVVVGIELSDTNVVHTPTKNVDNGVFTVGVCQNPESTSQKAVHTVHVPALSPVYP